MSIIKYFKRIRYIDFLIRRKATGNIIALAKKLSLSKRATQNYLSEMKELGFPIKYGKDCDCYYYNEQGKMVDELYQKSNSNYESGLGRILSRNEAKKIQGGNSFLLLDFFYNTSS